MSLVKVINGTTVNSAVVFTDTDGAAVDPASVVVKWKAPGVAAQSFTYGVDVEVVKTAVGHYNMDLVTAGTVGSWISQWNGEDVAIGYSTFVTTTPAIV